MNDFFNIYKANILEVKQVSLNNDDDDDDEEEEEEQFCEIVDKFALSLVSSSKHYPKL